MSPAGRRTPKKLAFAALLLGVSVACTSSFFSASVSPSALWVAATETDAAEPLTAEEAPRSLPIDESEKAAAPLTAEEQEAVQKSQESHQYQTEVSRLMDIIINSLYTQREVFLRELISNAVDALEKVRFTALSHPEVLEPKKNLDIRIEFDADAKTLSIIDSGIGMTKQDLINNLGTVAKSGTSNFLEAMAQGNDVNLIGQFGVGFYSAFLVADKVTVVSKNVEDDQHIWESSADAKFHVAKDPRGNTLGRGTCVTLHLKEDATEFLNEWKLKDLTTRFSQFMSYPIYVRTSRTVTEEVPIEDEEAETKDEDKDKDEDKEKDEDKDKDDVEVTEGDKDEKKDKPKTKKVEKKKDEWEQVNTQKAIWLRPKEEIEEKEYNEFYKSVSKDWSDPLAHIHFSAEGEVEFKALLYIPKRAPSDIYSNYFDKQTSVKVYVRRVLVADQFDDLLPKYLHFVKGVVDSDDLPLNVSREQLQQHKILNVISKKLVRKTLDTMRKLSVDALKEREEMEKELEQEEDEAKKKELQKKLKEKSVYERFYDEFSRNLKLGCYEDDTNRNKLLKLLRFHTSKSGPERSVTLESFVAKLPENQPNIYYAAGESAEQLMKAPEMQIFLKKDIEVLFLLEAMDEPCIQRVMDFEGKKFVSIQKGDVQLDQTEEEKKTEKRLKKAFEPLLSWWKKLLGEKVTKVEVSKRLVEAPCAVVASEWGYSAQMEKIMKTQTFADPRHVRMMAGQKVFEINPHHRMIQYLLAQVQKEGDNVGSKEIEMARLLFEVAKLASGFEVEDPKDVAASLYKAVAADLTLPTDEPMIAEYELPREEEDEKVGDEDAKDEEKNEEGEADEPEEKEHTEKHDEL
ncbi:putative heat shock protein 90 [Toxoplasma gondii GAB2-2007-GAL-DOM2]|uniref:Putative heat shock protein 90 n=6 Tax=Toxoplasma gondii TaxID=5811 RepID=S7VTT7_TOXGG|nr:putative heat shock protein 90 [Toxoplasma gondii GT1]KAF4643124.1 putative heat shock protein 90 [Toxoplasma gondii]KFG36566.1 putative heat shock protein 90 [Toxoplasma gondii GAB2-2007-GAL-DOM2]KFG51588.1 putative heat shock protein 90 [Toxoplasma gondii FOU]KFG99747.1 putative heat shock protein 90 [Toxoplasma gondii MAS]KFH04637.1 putative heat shock protein 90 [Toxoplasma gondii VAND]